MRKKKTFLDSSSEDETHVTELGKAKLLSSADVDDFLKKLETSDPFGVEAASSVTDATSAVSDEEKSKLEAEKKIVWKES